VRPLALPDPGQMMLIGERIPQMPQTGLAWLVNLAAFSAWQREANHFTGISLIISSRLPVMGSTAAAPAWRKDFHEPFQCPGRSSGSRPHFSAGRRERCLGTDHH
jgi:hypothetical protein